MVQKLFLNINQEIRESKMKWHVIFWLTMYMLRCKRRLNAELNTSLGLLVQNYQYICMLLYGRLDHDGNGMTATYYARCVTRQTENVFSGMHTIDETLLFCPC